MKPERLAGIAGEPTLDFAYHNKWYVVQIDKDVELWGPRSDDERGAVRKWNSMVRRIRKLNAHRKEFGDVA